ncbi:MAG: hypothetical protein CTY12_04650 [Methylotenera sp.]|nr:MAG: hypothetical protein CTY12_04650 [Methylotenera sp.]
MLQLINVLNIQMEGSSPLLQSVVELTTDEVNVVLDVPPTPNLTRRQDIGLLIYQLLLDKGYVGTLDPEV